MNVISVSSNSETLSLDVTNGEISKKEVESVMRSVKCGKAADGITDEMIK